MYRVRVLNNYIEKIASLICVQVKLSVLSTYLWLSLFSNLLVVYNVSLFVVCLYFYFLLGCQMGKYGMLIFPTEGFVICV